MWFPSRIAHLVQVASVAAAGFIFLATANAQVPTSGNVFFGYSFFNRSPVSINPLVLPAETNRQTLNGWEASVEGRILPFVGMVADFSGYYGPGQPHCAEAVGGMPVQGVCSGVISGEQNFLFGPRVSVPIGKIRLFAEGLFGAGRASTSSFGSDTSFATAIGGGLDYKIIKPVAWRLQGDYVQTRFFGATQNNVRISTGIVLRF